MHIKNIHSMIEKLSECAKVELDKGIEKIDTEEMSKVAEIIKELAEAEYYASVTKAMEEHDFEDEEDIMDEGRRGYRGQPRSKTSGRFMSRGDGRRSNGRRGYENAMMMYDEDWDEMERMRDMDRMSYGRMGYSGSGSSGGSSSGMSSGGSSSGGMSSGSMGSQGGSQGGNRGYSESRYERARRGYEETKAMHNSGSAEDKQLTMKEAEKMVNVIFDELEESLSDAPKEVKDMIKNKGMAKLQKI